MTITPAIKAIAHGHVFIATSIDGFIARRDGDTEWLNKYPSDGTDYGYGAFIEKMDGIVIGRGTFEKALSFPAWPYDKPVVVMSRSLSQDDLPIDLLKKVRITTLSPRETMTMLSAEGWQRAYVDGGKLIQSFLRESLIADIVLTRIPILLGDGINLFGPLTRDIQLTHIETNAFPSGFVQSTYRVCSP